MPRPPGGQQEQEEQPRDDQGQYVSQQEGGQQEPQQEQQPQQLSRNVRRQPDGQIEMKVKVEGEEQWLPEQKAREQAQKGQHYTQKMQELQRMKDQYQSAGSAGDNQGLQNGVQPGQSTLGSGGQTQDQPAEHPTAPADFDPSDAPDPVEEPEKFKQFMSKWGQYTQSLEQEVQQMKGTVNQVSQKTADQEEHEALSAEYEGEYDPQEVEDYLTRLKHENPQKYKEIGGGQSKPSKELAFHHMQRERQQMQQPTDNQNQETSENQQEGQRQRVTPHTESPTDSAPPAEQSGDSAPQQRPQNEDEFVDAYLEQNERRAQEPR